MRQNLISAITMMLFSTMFVTVVAHAEQLRYMDRAGNIVFVDRLEDVPREYRPQINPPTPTPILDKKARREREKAIKQQETERRKQEKEKKKEQRKREKAAKQQAAKSKDKTEKKQRDEAIKKGGF